MSGPAGGSRRKGNKMYSEQDVRKWLTDSSGFYTISVLEECDSTNNRIMESAREGATEGTVILADIQTGGKGRRGRSFFSPSGCGIYISILLRPQLEAFDTTQITLSAAVAVARAVESACALSPGIKWVNDLYYRDRKVCGILAEGMTASAGKIDAVVLGIGINVFLPGDGFPKEISNKAGALMNRKPDADSDRLRAKIAGMLLESFYQIYRELPDRSFLEEYRSRSFLTGRTVLVDPEGAAYPAVVKGIDEEGRLAVIKMDGTEQKLFAGEVSLELHPGENG